MLLHTVISLGYQARQWIHHITVSGQSDGTIQLILDELSG
jgi:hypothetical protein